MTSTDHLDPAVATAWLRRWDDQQEYYIADREERFTVIGDVVADTLREQLSPTVLDLGCGPGSLSTRLAARLPGADIVGVDADPLLLAMARTTAPPNVRFVETRLGSAGWPRALGLTAQVDAAVSTTALHWLSEPDLAQLYRDLAELIRPGGVFVDGDHFVVAGSRLVELQKVVRHGRAARQGVTENEDWEHWWRAVAADANFAELLELRKQRAVSADHSMGVGFDGHVDLLRQAGFREVGTVWQTGDDHVLVAVR